MANPVRSSFSVGLQSAACQPGKRGSEYHVTDTHVKENSRIKIKCQLYFQQVVDLKKIILYDPKKFQKDNRI